MQWIKSFTVRCLVAHVKNSQMHRLCEVQIFLVIFSYDYEVLQVSLVHRFQSSVLGSCLGYICFISLYN